MKKLIMFFSVFALITVCLANPPPVVVKQDIVTEFVADNLSADFDVINQEMNIEHPMSLQVALPLAFDMPNSLIIVPVTKISMQGMNYLMHQATFATQDIIALANKTIDYRLQSLCENWLYLAADKNEFTVMELSRLDIGEYVNLS